MLRARKFSVARKHTHPHVHRHTRRRSGSRPAARQGSAPRTLTCRLRHLVCEQLQENRAWLESARVCGSAARLGTSKAQQENASLVIITNPKNQRLPPGGGPVGSGWATGDPDAPNSATGQEPARLPCPQRQGPHTPNARGGSEHRLRSAQTPAAASPRRLPEAVLHRESPRGAGPTLHVTDAACPRWGSGRALQEAPAPRRPPQLHPQGCRRLPQAPPARHRGGGRGGTGGGRGRLGSVPGGHQKGIPHVPQQMSPREGPRARHVRKAAGRVPVRRPQSCRGTVGRAGPASSAQGGGTARFRRAGPGRFRSAAPLPHRGPLGRPPGPPPARLRALPTPSARPEHVHAARPPPPRLCPPPPLPRRPRPPKMAPRQEMAPHRPRSSGRGRPSARAPARRRPPFARARPPAPVRRAPPAHLEGDAAQGLAVHGDVEEHGGVDHGWAARTAPKRRRLQGGTSCAAVPFIARRAPPTACRAPGPWPIASASWPE